VDDVENGVHVEAKTHELPLATRVDNRTILKCIHQRWVQVVANYYCSQLPGFNPENAIVEVETVD